MTDWIIRRLNMRRPGRPGFRAAIGDAVQVFENRVEWGLLQ